MVKIEKNRLVKLFCTGYNASGKDCDNSQKFSFRGRRKI